MAALAQVGEATWWEALTRRGKSSCRAGSFGLQTKVNRCLTEGRRAFLQRLNGIESGDECERLAPQLSALADGEASGEDLAALRPHLRTCLICRARLREYRAVPTRVAALAPTAALATDGGGTLRGLVETLLGAAQHKAAALGERAHAAVELASGQKVAAVAASAAALAGGGATVDRLAERDASAGPPAAEVRKETREPAAGAPAPVVPPKAVQAPAAVRSDQPAQPAQVAPQPPSRPAPTPAAEFAPGAAPAPAPAPAPPPAPAAGGGTGAGSGPAGEFAP